MTFGGLLLLFFGSILVNNFVLSRFLGCCSFLGVSRKIDTAIGMGYAVTFVMALSSLITYLLYYFVLAPLKIEFLQTVSFILVIAALVQLVEMALQKLSPSLYRALGVYLPLITTNCAVLGVAVLNISESYNLLESLVAGVGGALGYMLAIVLFAGIRERTELSDVPEPFRGFPIALVTAALMAVAFMGFSGMI